MMNDPRFATIGVLAGLAVGLVLASTKADADSAKEVTTAASHAGFATKSADLKGTQMHLHHVVTGLATPRHCASR